MQLVISHLILLGENLCVSLVDGAQRGLEKCLCNGKNISQYLRLKYERGSALSNQQTFPGQRGSTAFATTPEGRTQKEKLQSGNDGNRRSTAVSRKGRLQHDMLHWARLLQLVARMAVYKIFKQGEGIGLVYRMGFSSGTEDASEATGKKIISLAAPFRGRKSLLKTKRENPTPVGTGDDLMI